MQTYTMYTKIMQRSSGLRKSLCAIAPMQSERPAAGIHGLKLMAATPPSCRLFTSSSPKGSYMAVDHSNAYEEAMQGSHGKQLALARLEGVGKDDLLFDPFTELEQEAADLEKDDGDDEKFAGVDKREETEENDEEEDEFDGEEDEGEDDELEFDTMYNPNGSLRRKRSVLATLRAGFPSGGQLAVVELGGAQFKVTTDDVIVVNRLKPVEKYSIGSVHTLTEVMLVGSSHLTLVGVPMVQGAEVDVMVEEITRDAKVIIFKKRRRKHSQRKNGFRRDVTILRVLDIRMPKEYRNHSHIGRDIVDTLDEHFEIQSSSTDKLGTSGQAPETAMRQSSTAM